MLDLVEKNHKDKKGWYGLDSLEAALDIGRSWPSVDTYVATMRQPIESRRQWGGYAEAVLISYVAKTGLAIFTKTGHHKYHLCCEPVIPPEVDPEKIICFVWSQSHYDVLTVSPDKWAKAKQQHHGTSGNAP